MKTQLSVAQLAQPGTDWRNSSRTDSRFPCAQAFLQAFDSGMTGFWAESRAIRTLERALVSHPSPDYGLIRIWSDYRHGGDGDVLPPPPRLPSATAGSR